MVKLVAVLNPPNFSFSKQDAVKSGRFVLYFILVYLAASLLFDALFPLKALELFIANNVLSFLQSAGYAGTVSIAGAAVISLQAGPSIEISELCTGRMELLIITSAIIASTGIGWRKRLFGVVAAGLATVAFNYVRIIVTIMLILGTGDLAVIDFAHNVLFRAFLFVTIAGLYVAWFYWAVSREAALRKAV